MRGSSSVRLIGLLSRISGGSARFCTDGFDGVESSRVKVFDRHLKRRQRDRAAWLTRRKDPLIDAVAENLLDRLEDCKRTFPTALCLGGSLGAVRRLLRGRGAIEKLIMMDASLDMVELCRNAEPDISDDKIETSFMVADEEFLPVKEGSLDLMISCLGLHWTNDLPGAMIQCRLALKPDGLFLEAILGGETLKELRIACTIAQMEREGDISPRLSPLAQVRDAGNLLTRACFALPGVDVDEYCVRYGNALELIQHLRQWVKPMLLHGGIDFKERYSFSNCCSVSVNVWSRGWNCSCNISGDLHDRVEKALFPAESQKEEFSNRIFQGHPEAIWS